MRKFLQNFCLSIVFLYSVIVLTNQQVIANTSYKYNQTNKTQISSSILKNQNSQITSSSFSNGTITNLNGCGIWPSNFSCHVGNNCNPYSGLCTTGTNQYMYKFRCAGRLTECRSDQMYYNFQGSNNVASDCPVGYTCQIDVFNKKCRPDGQPYGTWSCGSPIDYIVWYNDGTTPTPPIQTCSYQSTQARLHTQADGTLNQNLTVYLGTNVKAVGVHNQNAVYWSDTRLQITGPNSYLYNCDSQCWFTPPSQGTYTLRVTTLNQSGPNCEDTATLNVIGSSSTPYPTPIPTPVPTPPQPFPNLCTRDCSRSICRDPIFPDLGYQKFGSSRDQLMYKAIDTLECLQVINGYSNGYFQPNLDVSRAQMAQFIARGFRIPEFKDHECAREDFYDVPKGHHFYTSIKTLQCWGIVNGAPRQIFDTRTNSYRTVYMYFPDSPITRGDTARIMVLAARRATNDPNFFYDGYTNTQIYHDVVLYSPNASLIQGLYTHGVNDPQYYPYFQPGKNISRGEMSIMMYLAIRPVFERILYTPTY